MRLGTYTTIDCPTQKIDEAYEFLELYFSKINGVVRKVQNPHDFGSYPSFEIDYPDEIEELNDKYDDLLDEDDTESLAKLDDWNFKANEIEDLYNKTFQEYL